MQSSWTSPIRWGADVAPTAVPKGAVTGNDLTNPAVEAVTGASLQLPAIQQVPSTGNTCRWLYPSHFNSARLILTLFFCSPFPVPARFRPFSVCGCALRSKAFANLRVVASISCLGLVRPQLVDGAKWKRAIQAKETEENIVGWNNVGRASDWKTPAAKD
eukprot:g48794.t1